jgi:disulfide bond formation protein DsbB
LSFLLGVSFHALVALLCGALTSSFSTYLVALQIVSFVFFGFFFVIGRRWLSQADPPSSLQTSRLQSGFVIGIALAVGAFYFAAEPALDHRGDGYAHVGYIRTIVHDNELAPSGVLAPAGVPTPAGVPAASSADFSLPRASFEEGLFHPILAAMSRLAGLEPVTLWQWLPVLLAPLAVLVFFAFATVLLPGFGYAIASLLLFLMFQGGFGPDFLATVAHGHHLALVFF